MALRLVDRRCGEVCWKGWPHERHREKGWAVCCGGGVGFAAEHQVEAFGVFEFVIESGRGRARGDPGLERGVPGVWLHAMGGV